MNGDEPLSHRPVAPGDLPLICAFPRNAEELYFLFPKAHYPLTPTQLQAAIDQRSDSTVVLRAGRVAGFANLLRREEGGVCAIGNVIVDPAARGRGVGRYLVTTMTDGAFRRYRASEVRVACFNRNVAGLLLYTALGFTPFAIEERRDWRGDWVALIHLHRLAAGEP